MIKIFWQYRLAWSFFYMLVCCSFASVYSPLVHAELVVDEIINIISSKGIISLSYRGIEIKLLEYLNNGLKAIDPFAKIHWKDIKRDNFGIELFDSGDHVVVLPFQGGYAYSKGFTEPGFLTSINQINIESFDFNTILEIFHSIQADEAIIVVKMPANNELKTVPLRRLPSSPTAIELHTANSIQYIRIKDFQPHQTQATLRGLLASIEKSIQPIILDLRYCSGGDLFEAIDSISLFLPDDVPVAMTKDKRGEKTTYRSLTGKRITTKLPILLIGPHTASAAEVFTRTLSYYHNGLLVGRKTFGKCSSQKLVNLSSEYQLTYTNLQLLDPSGNPCLTNGIYPDVLVEKNKLNISSHVIKLGIDAWKSLTAGHKDP